MKSTQAYKYLTSGITLLFITTLAYANPYPTIGTVERLDPAIDKLIPKDAKIEVLADGFNWSEGPVWDRKNNYLLFSDVPENKIYKWSEEEGLSVWMEPSGYTGVAPLNAGEGSNGLMFNKDGYLVICEHGDHRVSKMKDGGAKVTIVDHYKGKRLNSPNDLAEDSEGNLFFTDPPYGLPGQLNSPLAELDYSGIYLYRHTGELVLLSKELVYPNGIALSPDERYVYVAQSYRQNPIIMRYTLSDDKLFEKSEVFFDGSELSKTNQGSFDGLKVDKDGNLFATGPGGVLVIDKKGELLGIIRTGHRIANVGFGNDGSMLYLTSDFYLARIQTSTIGDGF